MKKQLCALLITGSLVLTGCAIAPEAPTQSKALSAETNAEGQSEYRTGPVIGYALFRFSVLLAVFFPCLVAMHCRVMFS